MIVPLWKCQLPPQMHWATMQLPCITLTCLCTCSCSDAIPAIWLLFEYFFHFCCHHSLLAAANTNIDSNSCFCCCCHQWILALNLFCSCSCHECLPMFQSHHHCLTMLPGAITTALLIVCACHHHCLSVASEKNLCCCGHSTTELTHATATGCCPHCLPFVDHFAHLELFHVLK